MICRIDDHWGRSGSQWGTYTAQSQTMVGPEARQSPYRSPEGLRRGIGEGQSETPLGSVPRFGTRSEIRTQRNLPGGRRNFRADRESPHLNR
jgi:hypothetical protein